MRPPSLTNRALGHPAVALPLLCGGGATAAVCFYHSSQGGWLPGVMLVVGLGRVLKANEEATAYRHWNAAWHGMADPTPRLARRWGRLLWPLVGVAILAVLASAADAATFKIWLAGSIAIVGLLAIIKLAKRPRGRAKARGARGDTVQIVARPVLPVPSLADAYRALPDYCGTLP